LTPLSRKSLKKILNCFHLKADEPQPYGRSQKEFIAHGSRTLTEMKSFFRGSLPCRRPRVPFPWEKVFAFLQRLHL
jgi:hypothetical protein